ncbi:MAG: GNAT family N-acetyltransferase [Solirubrobacterales bacterium]
MKPESVQWVEGGSELLDRIEPLWEQLRLHHWTVSRSFKPYYEQFSFAQRKAMLLAKARPEDIRVFLAVDSASGRAVGQCVGTIHGTDGELDTLFVESECRGLGIGEALAGRCLAWLKVQGAAVLRVGVADGNEAAFGFYRRLGFVPRMTILQIPPKKTENSENNT